MTATILIKLLPSKEQISLLEATTREYISLVNDIVEYSLGQGAFSIRTTGEVTAELPSALKNQAIRDAGGVYRKCVKIGVQPILKKPVAIWNNRNYKVFEDAISFPVWKDGKSNRVSVKALIPKGTLSTLKSSKLGTLRVSKKNKKYIAQIAYEVAEAPVSSGTKAVGIDLGIKWPAVAAFEDGSVRFYGNGRQNKYTRRKHAARRKKLGKAKKLNAIRKSRNKEERWMKDQDHKMSRAIVNDAIAHDVGVIKMETLSGIRSSTRKSRKNNHSLHNWSFYRLAQYIEYKVKLAGIQVEYINPAYTSQTCPVCGERHHAKDRRYVCPKCGYRSHRDVIGARNILVA